MSDLFLIGYAFTKNCLFPKNWLYWSPFTDLHLASILSVDMVPWMRLISNILSARYLLASCINADLVSFCVVAFRVSAAWARLSPQRSIRSSVVVLECLLDDRKVVGSSMSCMGSSSIYIRGPLFSSLLSDMMSETILAAMVLAFS